MTYEEIRHAHIAELVALGVRPEDIPMVIEAEERTGHSFAESLLLEEEQPITVQDIIGDAIDSGYEYDEEEV